MDAFLNFVYETLDAHLTLDLLIYLCALVATILLSAAVGQRVTRRLHYQMNSHAEAATGLISRVAHALLPVITPMAVTAVLAVMTVLLERFGMSFQLFRAATILAFVWVVISLASLTMTTRKWARSFAVILWAIAALHILGWWSPALQTLDGLAYRFGETRVSLLMVIKGAAIFIGLIWGAGYLSRLGEQKLRMASELSPSVQVLFGKLLKVGLMALAILAGLSAIGLDLSTLTIFSGAAGLGLGFGLQKVFSNYISGIILLLDRSIKPGDVIALRQGETFGWVKALGSRYVSLITRDGKEHLIPNEMLITSEVENWSHTDYNVRLKIPVTIRYESDYKLAMELLQQVASERARVLKQPKPVARIVNLGADGIEMELRCWIRDPVSGVGNITSQIYEAMLDAFAENNIGIPYPQREVHFVDNATFRPQKTKVEIDHSPVDSRPVLS